VAVASAAVKADRGRGVDFPSSYLLATFFGAATPTQLKMYGSNMSLQVVFASEFPGTVWKAANEFFYFMDVREFFCSFFGYVRVKCGLILVYVLHIHVMLEFFLATEILGAVETRVLELQI
jgi:hypothetical protein